MAHMWLTLASSERLFSSDLARIHLVTGVGAHNSEFEHFDITSSKAEMKVLRNHIVI